MKKQMQRFNCRRFEGFNHSTRNRFKKFWSSRPHKRSNSIWTAITLVVFMSPLCAEHAMAQRTFGIDVSSYQGQPGWANFGGSWNQDADIANGNDADGRQEVMLIGNTGNLYSKFQTSVNGSWSGWLNQGGSFGQNYRIALGRNSDGRLEVFAIDAPSTALFHKWQTSANGGWSGWATLAGSWEADAKPVVAADQNGALEVLLIGHTGNLYHNYQTGGGWSGWLNLNGTFTQNIRPVLGPNQDGRLEWYSTGQGTDMVHIWETAPNSTSWSGYFSLGGSWN
jgi:hypothetical protein